LAIISPCAAVWLKEGKVMTVDERYTSDVEVILSHRYDNGADLWTTPDKRIIKGAPFSTIESVMYLLELGMELDEPILKASADLIFEAWNQDGRFRVYPTGAVYPCQTIMAAATLCHLGYASDSRIHKTLRHLLDTRNTDGGWRCKKFSFGRGRRRSVPIPYRRFRHLTRSDIAMSGEKRTRLTALWNSFWSTG